MLELCHTLIRILYLMYNSASNILNHVPKSAALKMKHQSPSYLQLWDFPGKLDISHLRDKEDTSTIEKIFVEARVLIFVIDPVEEKHSIAIDRLHGTILEAYKVRY